MRIRGKPPVETAIDEALVRALVRDQHPDLAHLPLADAGEGWDNRLFRLGDALVVRLPRRAAAAGMIEREHCWLPRLSPQLPLPVPAPLRIGQPGRGFPWRWSITAWLPGAAALVSPPVNAEAAAEALGRFLRALHRPAPPDAPRNPARGVPLSARASLFREQLPLVADDLDTDAVASLWDRALAARPFSGPPLWIHGDFHPGNLLVNDGRVSGVIDFADLSAGDPATDLAVAWMLLPPHARSTFFAAAQASDDDTRLRARGWALALGLAFVSGSQDDEALGVLGRTTIHAAVRDE